MTALPTESDARDGPTARRLQWVHWGVAVLGLLLTARLLHIQLVSRDQFASRASRQQVSEEIIRARPGDILDRRGRLLATTISVPSAFVNPRRLNDIESAATRLAAVLDLNRSELSQRLREHADKQFLWLKRRIDADAARELMNLKLPDGAVGLRAEFERHYPQGPLAAHVLGLRDIDGAGQGGVEESFNTLLRGRDGVRRFVRDARGFVLDILEEVTVPPQDGTSIVLTIDIVMQLHVEAQLEALMQQHRARGACAVVLDPATGEVLALASRPTFDPNNPAAAPPGAWKNLATSAMFEPGSTFKPMVVAWALEHDVIQHDDVFDCELGTYRMGRRLLHDHHPYGRLSLTDVLVKSSNIGMAKIGEALGNAELFKMASAFGFGRPTGIELPGEVAGLVHPLDDWTGYSTGSIPMGQELAATPMQVIAAHAMLANHGRRISPHLLRSTIGEAERPQQVLTSQVVAPDVANWIVRNPLVQVVQRGTGTEAQLSGRTVFGKTGTAQKAGADGYSHSRHVSSFVGGVPAENPRLLVLVSVDEPQGANYYGGSVAAPYVAEVLEYGLSAYGPAAQESPVELAKELETLE